jgi:hypothetical protein
LLLFSLFVSAFAQSPLPIASYGAWPTINGVNTFAADGNPSTQWIPYPCAAGAWVGNPAQNALFGACAQGACSSSCDSSSLASATDNNPYTGANVGISHAEAKSWVVFPLPKGPQTLTQVYLRGIWPAGTQFFAISDAGVSTLLDTLGPQFNYLDRNYPGPSFPVASFKLVATSVDGVQRGYCYAGIGDCKDMTITEIAAQTATCYEQVCVVYFVMFKKK